MWFAGGRLQNEATVAVCHVAQLGARAISDVETTWGSYLHFAGFETLDEYLVLKSVKTGTKRVLRTSSWSGLATFVRDCCGGVGAMLRVLGRYSVQCVETHTLFAEAAAGNISAQRRGYGASRCTGAKLPPEAETWCTCGCVN